MLVTCLSIYLPRIGCMYGLVSREGSTCLTLMIINWPHVVPCPLASLPALTTCLSNTKQQQPKPWPAHGLLEKKDVQLLMKWQQSSAVKTDQIRHLQAQFSTQYQPHNTRQFCLLMSNNLPLVKLDYGTAYCLKQRAWLGGLSYGFQFGNIADHLVFPVLQPRWSLACRKRQSPCRNANVRVIRGKRTLIQTKSSQLDISLR